MVTIKYEFGPGFLHKVSADTAAKVMQDLATSDRGLTPAALVDASRPEDAPLHVEFEWNDEQAAELYRRKQASNLINHLIEVRVETGKIERRPALVAIRVEGHSQRGEGMQRMSLARAMGRHEYREALLRDAQNQLLAWRRRYGTFAELAKVYEAIDALDLDDEKKVA